MSSIQQPGPVKVALFQMTSGIDPLANAAAIAAAAHEAVESGAGMIFTPEMCGLLDRDRARASRHIVAEADNPVLARARQSARDLKIWIDLGSLAILRDDGKWANRGFVIDSDGEIAARYDKVHMFDVDLATGETWRESAAYTPGDRVVAVDTPIGLLGMAICYDVRFPALFEELGRLRCDAIRIPAAFTVPTGKAHWHLLQRARAIEASAWVISAAQGGSHDDGRETYGHSLVVDPWGDIVLDGGEGASLGFATIDPVRTFHVRGQLPSLANKREIPRSGA
ncbi:MAG: carbon-nitrogen hydrolase family protein [Novosphingobium sp.]